MTLVLFDDHVSLAGISCGSYLNGTLLYGKFQLLIRLCYHIFQQDNNTPSYLAMKEGRTEVFMQLVSLGRNQGWFLMLLLKTGSMAYISFCQFQGNSVKERRQVYLYFTY